MNLKTNMDAKHTENSHLLNLPVDYDKRDSGMDLWLVSCEGVF